MFPLRNLLIVSLMFISVVVSYGDENEAIWQPKVGDSWVYQVTIDVPKGSKLPDNVEGQRIEELEDKQRASFIQTTVYKGVQEMSEGGAEAHAFFVSNGKQLQEIQFMKITPTSVEAMGLKPEGKEPQDVKPLSRAIPLVMSDWKGGEAFPFMMDHVENGAKMRMIRKFKVLGWETLETKAGKFQALHVLVTGKNGPIELNRSYWFSPGNGFIKEVKKYYAGEQTIFTQTRVLKKMGNK
ncbi:hypothetical protein JO972_00005 [Verrucomicrobiaceae bacterium 5K15]|uniref:Uncharacterized protein n=1 Tax=Oceaniferula flava TaxID=2800421 RepID=A0AAE2VB53_9BACT|nr:hypothetical protein [Oceaniferula flavus]MBK1853331.1 hypothetical protein [Oceaniferula flavus]MBM1134636.1 hypothetical protein [Oceaniferula flavus]